MLSRYLRIFLILSCFGLLAACDTAEERAEKHYQAALELLESGDQDRALVELRNVFKLEGAHYEARALYAGITRDMGRHREAYGQYLRLVEQQPDNLIGRVALSEMSFAARNWDEFERHSQQVIRIAPDSDDARVMKELLAYRQAVLNENEDQRRTIQDNIESLFIGQPDNPMLRAILIEGWVRDGDFKAALNLVDQALEETPDDRALHDVKLSVFSQQRDAEQLEAQLRKMIKLFPEDDALESSLLRFLMSRDQADRAEEYLRQSSDPNAEDQSRYINLVQFIAQVRGPEEAIAELDSVLPTVSDATQLKTIRAGLDFSLGRSEEAIGALETLLGETEESEPKRRAKLLLARMYQTGGNEVGARRLVEEVLATDATSVDALKMRAVWLIEGDDTDGAISALRSALDQAPQDFQAMGLMADAYTRAGRHELSRDFLSLAVDASGAAPEPSMRYARRLLEEDKPRRAEDVLQDALRLAPDNEALLQNLGRVYATTSDQDKAAEVITALRALGTESGRSTANLLEASLRAQTEGLGEAIQYLEAVTAGGDNDISANLALIRSKLMTGEPQEALSYVEGLLAKSPDSPQLQFLTAMVRSGVGNRARAIVELRGLATENPKVPQFWMQLARVQSSEGDSEAAQIAIESGLEANPGNPDLLWAKASFLEQQGDIDAAIAVYEELYEGASDSVVIANNLASLLSTHRADPESLERAFVIGRRLRGTDVPALQDTYGWILHKRGDHEEALDYLEGAAAGLPQDGLVQYHLGETYLALDRKAEALERFKAAVDLAGTRSDLPQFETARGHITRLEAELNP